MLTEPVSGAPGTGKTSLTSALAGVFGLDIYVLSLLDPSMNESQLMRLMSEVPSRCIVLLEDVDAAGLGKRSDTSGDARKRHQTPNSQDAVSEAIATTMAMSETKPTAQLSGISLSALLNAIDGVASHEGRILIMTTNAPDALDKALTRPGRVDMQIHFELPSRVEIKELFLSMYSDEVTGNDLKASPNSSKHSDRTANGTANGTITKVDRNGDQDKDVSELGFSPSEELQQMAGRFAEALPETKLSLADIQGFMLRYKRDPSEACRQASDWASERVKDLEAQKGDEESNGT